MTPVGYLNNIEGKRVKMEFLICLYCLLIDGNYRDNKTISVYHISMPVALLSYPCILDSIFYKDQTFVPE